MKFICYLLLLLISFNGVAQLSEEQQHQLDSLNTVISNPESHDTVIVMSYFYQAIIYHSNYPDSAIKICKKAEVMSEKLNFSRGKAESYGWLGFLLNNKGDVAQGLIYQHKALILQEELGNKAGVAASLMNIGAIHEDQKDHDKALEHFFKALSIHEEMGNKKGIANSLNNIGAIYNEQKENDKALEYYHKSLEIKEELGDKAGTASTLSNIGGIYGHQGNTPLALEYFLKSLQIQEETGNKGGTAALLNNVGRLEKVLGNYSSSEKYLQRSLKLANELGSPRLISYATKSLSELAKNQGRYEYALEMYEIYIQMKDSIDNEATQKAAIQQQAKYEYEKQKAIDDAEHDKQIAIENAAYENSLAIEQEEKAKQKVITYAIGGGLILVIGFLAFVFNRLRITKKQKAVIEDQKEVVELAHKKTHEQKEIIEEAHKEITDSINYAERIQRSFLASEELLSDNLDDYFVFFQPKEAVSGDFYWAGKLPNNNFAMVNADSTGHGVPGAIMSILNISSIEKAIEKGLTEPSAIFNDTRKTIIERLKKDGSIEGGKDGMDASIIVFDKENNKFTYTAAQNPIWVIRSNKVIQLSPEKMPVGKHDNDATPFVGGEFATQKGDIIYTLTDGYQDQFGGPKGKKFMVKKMREYILSISHLQMKEQHQKIKETFNNWKDDLEQIDDVCVIGVRI